MSNNEQSQYRVPGARMEAWGDGKYPQTGGSHTRTTGCAGNGARSVGERERAHTINHGATPR